MQDGFNAFFFNPPLEANYIPNILTEVYKDRVYDQFMPKESNGKLCIEIGANIGLVSYYFARHFEKVIALEPSARHFPVLEENLRYNKITNVLPLKLALSSKNGDAEFYHHPNQTMFSLRPEVNALPEEKETVQTMDIKTLFETYEIDHIDFMKADCEGSENDIIFSEGFEKVNNKIDKMVIELHTWNGINALRDYGFEVKQIPSEAFIISATRT